MKTSIVNLNKVKESSKQFRFDAEYFKPEYLLIENKIKANQYRELRDCISILTDYHANGSYETLRSNVTLLTEKNYAYMVRTVDLERDDYETDVIYVDEHAYNFLSKSKVFGTEVIINKIGNAGKVYIVPPLKQIMTLGMNQFMIRSNKESNNHFLYVYLTCKYGNLQLERRVTGAVPLSIDKESVKSVLIPALNPSFQDFISSIIKEYFDFIGESKKQYKQAEQILLSELDLLDWKTNHYLSFVRNFSDTQSADRIDAEYFQPMYDEVTRAISSSGDFSNLGDLVSVKKCVEPGSEAYQESGLPFLRVSNLSKFGINNDNQKYLSEELYKQLKQHQPQKGEILLSKDATPGIAFYSKDEPGKMIPSGGILRLTVKDSTKILPEYLTLVLDSILVQKQIERDTGGSIINHWLVDHVKSTLIPILPVTKQKEISEKVNDSFCNRTLAKRLLGIAKRGVELAIEENEQSAEKWIKRELDKLGVET